MLGALRVPGSPAVMTGEGATESEVFRPSVQQVLGPRLVPGMSSCWTTWGGLKP
jgi:hypothetical protein